jgi:hypothetical protein
MSSPSSLRLRCPKCQKLMAVPTSFRGKTVTCPHAACRTAFPLEAPAAPAAASVPAAPARRGIALWVAGGCLALCFVLTLTGAAVVAVVVKLGLANGKPAAQVAQGGGDGAQPTQGKAAAENAPPRNEPKAAEPSRPTGGAEPTKPEAGKPAPATEPKPPGPDPAPAPARPVVPLVPPPPDGLEFPPVGPAKPSPANAVAGEFKAARAAYLQARKQARTDLNANFVKWQEEIQKSNLDAPAKNKAQQPLQAAWREFTVYGIIPSHPAMQQAVADYWKTLEAAAQKLGEVADKGLAAYEKAGVSDPAKLRPLQAAQLASRHTDLVGIWSYPPRGSQALEVWVIDFDERTGGWQVAGILWKKGVETVSAIYRGEKIDLKESALSFVAVPVDGNTGKAGSAGPAVTMKLQGGTLRYQTANGAMATTVELQRTADEESRERLSFYLKKGGDNGLEHPSLDRPADALDVKDANAVWRELAGISAFACYWGNGGPQFGQRLYIPYRASHMTPSAGPYGGLADLLLGRAPGAGENQKYTELWYEKYDSLADTSHPYLQRANHQALLLCRARHKLGEADELFGNTPASSVREFQQKVFIPAVKYELQRDADRAELQESLQREHPDKEIVVLDAPPSAESRQKLNELLEGIGGLMEDAKKRTRVSGLLAYADMAEVDREAAFWQAWLLPLARRAGGPPADKPLLAVEGTWRARSAKDRFQRLDRFALRNVSGQKLTNGVVELIAENEWGEKAAHYCCPGPLKDGEVVQLVPHPRWDKRRLDFTNSMKVTWSVWADQGSEVGRHVKLTSPAPNPDPAGWRKDYLNFDKKFAAEGEALGAVVRNLNLLPVNSKRQQRLLQEAAAPGTSYVFRLTAQGKPGKNLVLRFVGLNPDRTAVEAEVFDLGDRKPFRADTPVWKGKLTADPQAGSVFRMDAGWTFLLGPDDQPRIAGAGSGPDDLFPAKELPLFPVQLP